MPAGNEATPGRREAAAGRPLSFPMPARLWPDQDGIASQSSPLIADENEGEASAEICGSRGPGGGSVGMTLRRVGCIGVLAVSAVAAVATLNSSNLLSSHGWSQMLRHSSSQGGKRNLDRSSAHGQVGSAMEPAAGRKLWMPHWLEHNIHGACQSATDGVLQRPAQWICPDTSTSTTTTTLTTTSTSITSSTATSATTLTTLTTTLTSTTKTTHTRTTMTETRTSTSTTSTTMRPLWPYSSSSTDGKKKVIKGISYAPVPLKTPGAVLPDDDFMSSGTSSLWDEHGVGSLDPGRADFKIMRALGANAVRLYGNDPSLDHSMFLNEAGAHGLDVLAGISDYPYVQMHGNCMETDWDCYRQIKHHYGQNLKRGFRAGPFTYHPALKMVILMNEPDLKFEGGMRGTPGNATHFAKALISGIDGIIDAEKEAKVTGLAPNFTVAFSFGRCDVCSRFKTVPSLGQMWEFRSAMKDPRSVGYTARNDLWYFYKRRFVNSFNTANPATDIRPLFLDAYEANFPETPVFIGEYHAPTYFDQGMDLQGIIDIVSNASSLLLGISFFEFQVRYDKGGGEMAFGMFGLTDDNSALAETRVSTKTYSTRCLTPVKAKQGKCGTTLTDVDYVIDTTWTVHLDHLPTMDLCCMRCQQDSRCTSWTFVKDAGLEGVPSQCWLKGKGKVSKAPKKGVISGLLDGRSGKDDLDSTGYVHTALTQAFGGTGVTRELLCPVPSTSTTQAPATTFLSTTSKDGHFRVPPNSEFDEDSRGSHWPGDKKDAVVIDGHEKRRSDSSQGRHGIVEMRS